MKDPTRVDASDYLSRAKARAIKWDTGAKLLSIQASPVVDKKVDLSQPGARIVYTYASPTATAPDAKPSALPERSA